jgi:hypothetical protein
MRITYHWITVKGGRLRCAREDVEAGSHIATSASTFASIPRLYCQHG